MKIKYIGLKEVIFSPIMLLPIQVWLMLLCVMQMNHPLEEVRRIATTGWAGWLLVACYNIQMNHVNMKRTVRFSGYEIRSRFRRVKVALKLRYTLGRK
jgi:hypothetical protein